MWKLRLRGLVTTFVVLGAVGVAGSLLVTLIPLWPLTLFEHFRIQYVAVGVLVVGACAALRVRGWFDAALVATLGHLVFVTPDLVRSRRPVPAGTPVRVLLLNVHTSSTAHDAVARLIAETDADVVALLEVDERWTRALAPVLAAYPARLEHPRSDNFGLSIYTRGALTAAIENLGSLPSIAGTLEHRGARLGFVLTHPIPPVTRSLVARHAEQLAAVGARTRELGPHALVLGDFNATPWSAPFRTLGEQTGLCDTRAGFGLQATFPAISALLRIPIDHVLASCTIGVRDRWIARDVGSDHLPVVVDLVVPP